MKTTPTQKPSNTVYISNLSYERDRNGLRSMFAPFGQILNIKIIVEPSTNQSRGMAFVEMATIAEAQAAIDGLDQKVYDGRTVKAKFATPLKKSSVSKVKAPEKKKAEKDLTYVKAQLAKKARNEQKRPENKFAFKNKTKAKS